KNRDAFFNNNNNVFWNSRIENYETKSDLINDSLSTGTNEVLKIEHSYTIMQDLMEVLMNETNF
ncbi:TPA: hypothetical protein ACSK91_002437, partial [Listeria innocua]